MYELVEMLEQYRGEDDRSNGERWNRPFVVRYLSVDERAQYLLTVRDGLLYDSSGNLFDTTNARTAHGKQNRAIFVMDRDGAVYASKDHDPGVFHHSSLLAGGPVASAGEMEVIEGRVMVISNASGHYRPQPRIGDQILAELSRRGVRSTAEIELERI